MLLRAIRKQGMKSDHWQVLVREKCWTSLGFHVILSPHQTRLDARSSHGLGTKKAQMVLPNEISLDYEKNLWDLSCGRFDPVRFARLFQSYEVTYNLCWKIASFPSILTLEQSDASEIIRIPSARKGKWRISGPFLSVLRALYPWGV